MLTSHHSLTHTSGRDKLGPMMTSTHPETQSPRTPNQDEDVHMADESSDFESSTGNLMNVDDPNTSGSTDDSMETTSSDKTEVSLKTASSQGTDGSGSTAASGSTATSYVTAISGSSATDPAATAVAADVTVTKTKICLSFSSASVHSGGLNADQRPDPQHATPSAAQVAAPAPARQPRTRTMVELGNSSHPDKPWYLVDQDTDREVKIASSYLPVASLAPPNAAPLFERITVLRPAVLDQLQALQQMKGDASSPIKLPLYLYRAREECNSCSSAGRECILHDFTVLSTQEQKSSPYKCVGCQLNGVPVCEWANSARRPGRFMVYVFHEDRKAGAGGTA